MRVDDAASSLYLLGQTSNFCTLYSKASRSRTHSAALSSRRAWHMSSCFQIAPTPFCQARSAEPVWPT